MGLSGSEALIKLFLEDGTTKVFEADRDCYLNSGSNAITSDGIWLIQTGDVIIYGADEEGYLTEIEVKNLYEANTAKFKVGGYFDGYAVNNDAFFVYYTDETSTDGDDYRIAAIDELCDSELIDVKYSVNHNHFIDFMFIKYLPVGSVYLDKASIAIEAESFANLVSEIEPDTANIRDIS